MNNYISYVTKNVNVTMINNFIKKYENDFLIKFSEDSFIKIFLYLLITIKRISEGFSLEDKKHKAAL